MHMDMATRIRNRSRSTSIDRKWSVSTLDEAAHGLQFTGGQQNYFHHHPNSEIYDANLLSMRDLPSKSVTEDEFNRYLHDRDHRFYRRRIKSFREADRIDDSSLSNKTFQPQINTISSKLSDKANAKFINRVLSSSEHLDVLKSSADIGDDSVIVHSRMQDKVVSNSLRKDSLTTNDMSARNRSVFDTTVDQQQQQREDQVIYIPGSDSYGVVDVKCLDVFDRLCLRSNVHAYRRSNNGGNGITSVRSTSPAINERSRQLVESQRNRIRAKSSSPSMKPLKSCDYYAYHGVPERYLPPPGATHSKDFLRGAGLSRSMNNNSSSSSPSTHLRGSACGSRDDGTKVEDGNTILRGLNRLVRDGILKYKLKSALSSTARDPSPNIRSHTAAALHVQTTFEER